MAWTVAIVSIPKSVYVGEAPGCPVNSSVVQFLTASELTQMAPLPRCLSEALTRSSCGCGTWLSFSSQEKHTTSLHPQLFTQIRATKPFKSTKLIATITNYKDRRLL